MIVCLCHSVSDRTLRELAACGLTHEEVARTTGAGTACGCCQPTLSGILTEDRGCASANSPCPGCPRHEVHGAAPIRHRDAA